MIARTWNGTAPLANADAYVAHLREKTFPHLRTLAGHRGAYVLRRDRESTAEFTVITTWESIEAIRAFAGTDAEIAVVPPEAQALLASFDSRAVHWEIPLHHLL